MIVESKKGSMAVSKEEEKETTTLQPLASGMPPWHAAGFVGALLAMTTQFLPTVESLDKMATIPGFTKRVFPELMSLRALAIIRLSIATLALSLTIYLILGPGWQVFSNYKPHSKLRREFIKLKGLGTLCPFTSWCWLFLGLSFLLNGSIALAVDMDRSDLIQPWMLRTAIVLWELSAPFALLVSTVIKYVIWPVALAGGKPHNLTGFRNQLQHNFNSIFSLVEVALLGGINVNFMHLSLATMVGIIYILFSWVMAVTYYGNKEVGPQYIYWFFDTTLGKTTTIALISLLVALTTFFGIFAGLERLIETIRGNLLSKVVFVVAVSNFVCKFR
jgi:hypothetical protein